MNKMDAVRVITCWYEGYVSRYYVILCIVHVGIYVFDGFSAFVVCVVNRGHTFNGSRTSACTRFAIAGAWVFEFMYPVMMRFCLVGVLPVRLCLVERLSLIYGGICTAQCVCKACGR